MKFTGGKQLHAVTEAFHGGYVSALRERNHERTNVDESNIDHAADDKTANRRQNVPCDGIHDQTGPVEGVVVALEMLRSDEWQLSPKYALRFLIKWVLFRGSFEFSRQFFQLKTAASCEYGMIF